MDITTHAKGEIDPDTDVAPPPGHARMYVMDRTGDTRITWDKRNADEVEGARAQFDAYKAKHFLAYKVNPADATKGEVMQAFDAEAEKVIFSPPMRAG